MGLKADDQVKLMDEVDAQGGRSSNIDVIKIEKMAHRNNKWMWYKQE
jgi:hypothetical protein